MTWTKFDHGFLHHEKYAALTAAALMLHMCGVMHSSEHLTDGRVPKARSIRGAYAGHLIADGQDVDKLAQELIDAGVWDDWPHHWEILGYLEHNRSKTEVDALKAANRRRQAKFRAKKSTPTTATDTDTGAMGDSAVSNGVTFEVDEHPDHSFAASVIEVIRDSA